MPELVPVPGQIPSGSEAAAERAEAAVQVLPPSLQSAALSALVASLPAEWLAEAAARAELPAEAVPAVGTLAVVLAPGPEQVVVPPLPSFLQELPLSYSRIPYRNGYRLQDLLRTYYK